MVNKAGKTTAHNLKSHLQSNEKKWRTKRNESIKLLKKDSEDFINSESQEVEFDSQVKQYEFDLVKLVIENNLSFEVGESIHKLMKKYAHHPQSIKKSQLNNKKISDIVREVSGCS